MLTKRQNKSRQVAFHTVCPGAMQRFPLSFLLDTMLSFKPFKINFEQLTFLWTALGSPIKTFGWKTNKQTHNYRSRVFDNLNFYEKKERKTSSPNNTQYVKVTRKHTFIFNTYPGGPKLLALCYTISYSWDNCFFTFPFGHNIQINLCLFFLFLHLLGYVSRAHEIAICPSSLVRPSVS